MTTVDNPSGETPEHIGIVLAGVVKFVAEWRGLRARLTRLFDEAEIPFDPSVFAEMEKQRDLFIQFFEILSQRAEKNKIDATGLYRLVVALRANTPSISESTIEMARVELVRLEHRLSEFNGRTKNDYPWPDDYDTDEWIYENIHFNTVDGLSAKHKKKKSFKKSAMGLTRNAYKNRADRFADFHEFEHRRFNTAQRVSDVSVTPD